MSVAGHEIPLGKSTGDIMLRSMIFDIIHPYCLSPEDMKVVNEADHRVKNVWLETFTNTQKGIIGTSFLNLAKDEFRSSFFPNNGAYPPSFYGKQLGLPAGKSMLERSAIIVCIML